MVASKVFSRLVSLFLIALVGYALTKVKVLDEKMVKGLSGIITMALMPAQVLRSLITPFSREGLAQFGIMLVGLAVMVAIGAVAVFVYGKARHMPAAETGAWMYATAFPNAIFMGKPILDALYGEQAMFLISGIAFSHGLISFSIGIRWIQMGLGGPKSGVKGLFKSLLNPTLIACFVGFLLYLLSVPVPSPVLLSMDFLASMLSPLSMLIIGFSIAGAGSKQLFGTPRFYVMSAIRLLLVPVLFYYIIRPFVADPMILGVLVVVAAMPMGALVSVVCDRYGNPNAQVTACGVALSSILCLATTPAVVAFLGL